MQDELLRDFYKPLIFFGKATLLTQAYLFFFGSGLHSSSFLTHTSLANYGYLDDSAAPVINTCVWLIKWNRFLAFASSQNNLEHISVNKWKAWECLQNVRDDSGY